MLELGTIKSTVCTGSNNLLIDLAGIFASIFSPYVRPRNTPNLIIREPTNCVSTGWRREEGQQYTAAIQYILLDFDDIIIATGWVGQCLAVSYRCGRYFEDQTGKWGSHVPPPRGLYYEDEMWLIVLSVVVFMWSKAACYSIFCSIVHEMGLFCFLPKDSVLVRWVCSVSVKNFTNI